PAAGIARRDAAPRATEAGGTLRAAHGGAHGGRARHRPGKSRAGLVDAHELRIVARGLFAGLHVGVERARWVVVPIVVAAALFLPAVGQRTIFISDEARYALLARNMVEQGHWLVPHIDREVHMEKPPLFMWAIALLSLPTRDVSELTATLPAALSAIGGVAGTFLLGRRLFGGVGGFLAAVILAAAPGYFSLATVGLARMTVAFFILWGGLVFLRALGAPR